MKYHFNKRALTYIFLWLQISNDIEKPLRRAYFHHLCYNQVLTENINLLASVLEKACIFYFENWLGSLCHSCVSAKRWHLWNSPELAWWNYKHWIEGLPWALTEWVKSLKSKSWRLTSIVDSVFFNFVDSKACKFATWICLKSRNTTVSVQVNLKQSQCSFSLCFQSMLC